MTMQGIDISSYQTGINVSALPIDFVIVKATQGTGYSNPDYSRACNQTLGCGKLLGVYHYVGGQGADAEMEHFVRAFEPYRGKAVPCLDWESNQNKAWGNVGYLDQCIKRFVSLTGIPPIVYGYASGFPWDTAKANNCGTWVAQYANMNATGLQEHPWNEGAYSCTIRQYASTLRLDGWNGNLDANKAYMDRETWGKYANPNATTGKHPEEEPDMAVGSDKMYRLFNPKTGEHMYTSGTGERDALTKDGWTLEGVGWEMPMIVPIYRLFDTKSGWHMWTASLDECNNLIKNGWRYEGVGGYGSTSKDKPVYRLFRPTDGQHFWTMNADERDNCTKNGWTYEGIAFYAK